MVTCEECEGSITEGRVSKLDGYPHLFFCSEPCRDRWKGRKAIADEVTAMILKFPEDQRDAALANALDIIGQHAKRGEPH